MSCCPLWLLGESQDKKQEAQVCLTAFATVLGCLQSLPVLAQKYSNGLLRHHRHMCQLVAFNAEASKTDACILLPLCSLMMSCMWCWKLEVQQCAGKIVHTHHMCPAADQQRL